MRVLVCGSRSWISEEDGTRIFIMLTGILANEDPEGLEIIHGGALGADEWAMQWATDNGIKHIFFPPDWELYGKRAGIVRNIQMLDYKPDLVIAFWDGSSRGTKHTIEEATRRGIPTKIVAKYLPKIVMK